MTVGDKNGNDGQQINLLDLLPKENIKGGKAAVLFGTPLKSRAEKPTQKQQVPNNEQITLEIATSTNK